MAGCASLRLSFVDLVRQESKLISATARGTTEPLAPKYGVVVGDNIFAAVKAVVPDVTGYSVNYPASFELDSKAKGAADVVRHLNEQSKACPKQKFALIGYSQGGDVVYDSTEKIDKSLYDSIVALVLFVSPFSQSLSRAGN